MYSIKKVCTFKNKGHWPLKYVNILYIICISIFLYSTSDSDYPASSNFRHMYICDRICEKGSSTHIQFPNFDNLTFDWKRLLLWNLHCSETKHWLMNRENVSSIWYLTTKLYTSKFLQFNVCGRPLFANLVTFIIYQLSTVLYCHLY